MWTKSPKGTDMFLIKWHENIYITWNTGGKKLNAFELIIKHYFNIETEKINFYCNSQKKKKYFESLKKNM